MKVEFEISDKQISDALEHTFRAQGSFSRTSTVQTVINQVVEKEVAAIISGGAFKEQLVTKIHERIDDMASERILTLAGHLIRAQVKAMSDSGELEAAMKGAIAKAKD